MGISVLYDLVFAVISLNSRKLPAVKGNFPKYEKMASSLLDATNNATSGRLTLHK